MNAHEITLAHSWRAFPVGPFPLADETTAPNGVRVCDRYDVATVQHCFRHVPARLFRLVKSHYETLWQTRARREANLWAWTVAETLASGRAGIAESEDEIQRTARRCALDVSGLLAVLAVASNEAVRRQLGDFLARWNVPVPKRVTLAGLCARMCEASWWRRQLRAHVARALEAFARDIGAVHRRAGVYVSDDAQARHEQRTRRGRGYIAATEVHNLDTGEVLPLADVVKGSVSNPVIRRGELMMRARGFEEWADSRGHVSMFYTLTAPSRFHARDSGGRLNPKHDGSNPRAGQAHLCQTWAGVRAWAHRNQIRVYGFRVAEPHHDGTPHWHLLLFMPAGAVDAFTAHFRAAALAVDGDEAGAAEHRFKAVAIDKAKGSAAGYIAKYIAKNIDGAGVGGDLDANGAEASETCERARAWASTWGIRQFQQIGGPGVGVWRELRRLREVPEGATLAAAWACADEGNWSGFVGHMGGTECARADRPIAVWTLAKPGRLNRYHEQAAPRVRGLTAARGHVVTRPHEWALRPCFGLSRTRGNNCTATDMRGHGAPREKIESRPAPAS